MNCRIIYKDNKIDHVQAENGERSILFDSLKDIFGAEKALELYALTEEDGYKQKIQEKVRSFVGVTEKQIDKLSEAIDAQETLNKLVETGLADNVYQLSSEELENKLVELGVEADVAKQVVAYHGSPHSFDRFTTEKIGTGEGNQAFGWGLYFTDLESIAREYADKLRPNILLIDGKTYDEVRNEIDNPVISWIESYVRDGLNKEQIIIKLNDQLKDKEWLSKNTWVENNINEALDYIKDKTIEEDKSNRNIYKVSLHKGKTPSEYTWLEWDREVPKKQLDEISKNVLDKTLSINTTGIFQFQKNGKFYRGEKTNNEWKFIDRNTGESVEYSEVSNAWQELYNEEVLDKKEFKFYKRLEDFLESDKNASLFLLESGIDGIKYPAESISRGATSDNARGFNYVVFDENAITIEEQIQFQKVLNKVGIDMIVNGFVYKNQVFLNKDVASNETAIHEFSHLFNSWLKENRKELYNKGIDLVKVELEKENSDISEIISYVRITQPDLKGEALYEEILTEVVSRYSGQLMDEQKIKSPLMQWLSDFWKTIADLFNIFELSPSQVANLTLKEFSEYSVSTLINNDIVLEKLIQLNIIERLC